MNKIFTPTSIISYIKQCAYFVFPYIFKDKLKIVAVCITLAMILLDSYVVVTIPKLLSNLVKYYKQHKYDSLDDIVIFLGILLFVKNIISPLRRMCFFYVSNSVTKDIKLDVVTHMHKINIKVLTSKGSIDILSIVSRVSDGVRNFLNTSVVGAVPSILKTVMLFYLIINQGIQFAYVPCGVILIYIMFFFSIKYLAKQRYDTWEATDKVTSNVEDSLINTKLHRFNILSEIKKLNKRYTLEKNAWFKERALKALVGLGQGVIFTFFSIVLFLHIVYLLKKNMISLDKFILIKSYIFIINNATSKVTSYLRTFIIGSIDLKKSIDLLNIPSLKKLRFNKNNLDIRPVFLSNTTINEKKPMISKMMLNKSDNSCTKSPILSLKNVFFRYNSCKNYIINNLCLDIHKGDKILLTGKSGIGKSTLCHLVSGLYTPTKGEIYFKNTSLNDMLLSTFGKECHFISQDAQLSTGSIKSNILNISNKLNTLSTIKYLQNTYLPNNINLNREIGKYGSMLSGGERQRIIIARSMQKKPSVLILDEALCYLGESVACKILDSIFKVVPTVIIVTHNKTLMQKFSKHIHIQSSSTLLTHKSCYDCK